MKKLKYFVLLLIAITWSSFMFTGCGNENRIYVTEIKPTDIATLSIFTFDGKGESVMGLMNLGHTFLVIENLGDDDIVVGNKRITAHEMVAFGTWSILEHFGVWYNVESNYIKHYDKYDGRVSITTGIDGKDISVISDFIQNNGRWNPLNNCSYFSVTLWNEVAEANEKINNRSVYTPFYISTQIKKFDNWQLNKPINTEDFFGYFDGENYKKFNMQGV